MRSRHLFRAGPHRAVLDHLPLAVPVLAVPVLAVPVAITGTASAFTRMSGRCRSDATQSLGGHGTHKSSSVSYRLPSPLSALQLRLVTGTAESSYSDTR